MKKLILPLMAATILGTSPADAQTINTYDPFGHLWNQPFFGISHLQAEPKMDVADLKDKIEVKAELPGMEEKDINLSVDNGILTLSGTRQNEVEEQSKDYYVKEMSSGSFSRSIRLPQNIDESKIDAVFKNGILTITVPKTAAPAETVKKIQIKTE